MNGDDLPLVTRRERVEARKFMVGIFMPTMNGGWTVSRATNLNTNKFSYLKTIALQAEQYELDYLFLAGGYTPKLTAEFRFRDKISDAIGLASALGALTTQPMVIATWHILYRHAPLFVAKLAAGIDEITDGGFGINVVCGLTPNAPAMFDFEDSGDHDERYLAAAEFIRMLKLIWGSNDPVDFSGKYYQTRGAFLDTKPVQQPSPLLVNAGFSDAGQTFAAELCDWSFIVSDSPTDYESVTRRSNQIRARYAANGRKAKICMHPYIICRETEAEVQEVRDHIWQHADMKAVAQQFRAFKGADSMMQSHSQTRRELEDYLFIGTFQVFGTPEQVLEKLVRLHQAGVDGIHMVFLDWHKDLAFFCERVLPQLRAEVGDVSY
ncbi:MAG: LLM class flavin-dependent oxidoreductase [Pseudomonadales bacterium]|nr:LLM class flavin-dependent oxidoreductase [Pseudomonadales bacterium]